MAFGNHLLKRRFLIEDVSLEETSDQFRIYLSSKETYQYPYKSDRIKIFFEYKHSFWAQTLISTTYIIEAQTDKQIKFEMVSAYDLHFKKAIKWLKEACRLNQWHLQEIS